MYYLIFIFKEEDIFMIEYSMYIFNMFGIIWLVLYEILDCNKKR